LSRRTQSLKQARNERRPVDKSPVNNLRSKDDLEEENEKSPFNIRVVKPQVNLDDVSTTLFTSPKVLTKKDK
jgi:hypothetical protein